MSESFELAATTRQFESWRGVGVLVGVLREDNWVVAGGQMVAVRLGLAGLPFPRVTADADAVIDVRARPDATQRAAQALVEAGWKPSGADQVVHRFSSAAGGVVDLLGPDGLRSKPLTLPPARTLLAPGGTQLLRRSENVLLRVRGPGGSLVLDLRVPTRLGALVGKAAALTLAEGRERHLLDAVHLLAALRPGDLDEELTRADRRWFRGLLARLDRPAGWRGVDRRVELLARSALMRVVDVVGL